MSTDSEIIRRSENQPAAFGELYDRHASSLYRYAARRAGVSIADDIVSETFLVAFERRDSFDPQRDDAAPWLFGIATNLLRRHYRSELQILTLLASSVEEPAEGSRSDERIDAASAVAHIADAVKRMPAIDRDTLLLHAWADLSYEEIAQAMDVPIGTVRSRLNRARRVLRAAADTEHPVKKERDHGRADASPQAT